MSEPNSIRSTDGDVLKKVRRALGHGDSSPAPPPPPPIDEPITRLVHSDIGLAELFVRTAGENKILIDMVSPGQIAPMLCEFLRSRSARRIALGDCELLHRLGLPSALRADGFEVKFWSEMTLDELYDFDAGVTDVYAAVAEIGGLVVRASTSVGPAVSLVPAIHVAVVEPKNLLPDLVDLFQKLAADPPASSTTIITGPSKTSDIEMNLVVGVHGPTVVRVFVLQ
jgi:L-lactate dehydrogenase complex protein LldG